jgi:hypothetical protein
MIDSSSPNQPVQNYEIVNPGLETQVAALLPSVAGYGGNLRATNTIIPIVDLTAAAEGSQVPESMQQAIAFGSQTAISQVGAGTSVIANSPGFWRLIGTVTCVVANATQTVNLAMSDGISTKNVWGATNVSNIGRNETQVFNLDYIFFLAASESLSVVCSTNNLTSFQGSVRQVGTVDGTLVTPSGF